MNESIVVNHGDRVKRVWNITVKGVAELSKINGTLFNTNLTVNRRVSEFAIKLYKHMMPGNRPCHLIISVYSPLSDEQAKNLNNRNSKTATSVSNAAGSAVLGSVGAFHRPAGVVAAAVVKKVTLDLMLNMNRNWSGGDLLIVVDGTVNGGIGQPHSVRTEVLTRNTYDPNGLKV